MRNIGYSDPYGPARKLAGNIGALGNEGASRVAPVALFGWNSDPALVGDMASKLTKITNCQKSAVFGAALQALAVHTAFNWDSIVKENNQELLHPVSRGRLRSRLKTLSPTVSRRIAPNQGVMQARDQENIPMNSSIPDEELTDFDYKEFCNQLLKGMSNAESKTATLFENLKSLMGSR